MKLAFIFFFFLMSQIALGQIYQKDKIIFKVLPFENSGQNPNLKSPSSPSAPLENVWNQFSSQPPQKRFPQIPATRGRNKNGQPLVDLSNIYSLSLDKGQDPDKALAVLKAQKNVVYAEFLPFDSLLYLPNDPYAQSGSTPYSQYDYLSKIKAYEAWDIQKGDPATIVGIIDGGFWNEHEDLSGNLHPDFYDFGNYDDDIRLLYSNSGYHGIAIAGLISATPDNNLGMTGVAFNCRYLPLKGYADNFSAFNQVDALMHLADRNVKVINMSYGGIYSPSKFFQDLYNYLVINKDIALVAAAGNANTEDRFYPATYKNVLSVAATNASDDVKAWFSTYNYDVDISAPGIVMTTYPLCPPFAANCKGDGIPYNNGVAGTSFAAPLVSGALALVRTQFPDLTAIQAMARLRATADTIDHLNLSIYKEKLGRGRLNIYRALTETNVKALQIQNFQTTAPANAGQKVKLLVEVQNILNPVSSLQLVLTSASPFVKVTDSVAFIGSLATLASAENISDLFEIEISSLAPSNINVPLRLAYQDGTFNDYQYFYITLFNQEHIEFNTSHFQTTFGSRGQIGQYDQPEKRGITFGNSSENNLVSLGAGLILATSKDTLVDSAPNFYDFHDLGFTYNKPIHIISSDSILEAVSVFKDTSVNLISTPITQPAIGLNIEQRVYSLVDSPEDKFIVLEYRIFNNSKKTIPILHTALFSDWDLPNVENYAFNKTDWDTTYKLGYAFRAGQAYAGLSLLSDQKPIMYGFDNDGAGGSIRLYQHFSKIDKYTAISNGVSRTKAGGSTGNDVSVLVGGKIENLKADSTQVIAIAMVAGNTLEEIQQNTQKAKQFFIKKNTSPTPKIADTLMACLNGSIRLQPSNGTKFRFYAESNPTTVFDSTTFTITNITQNQVWYIINKDGLFNSLPKKVWVQIEPEPSGEVVFTEIDNKKWQLEVKDTSYSVKWELDGITLTGNPITHNFINPGNYTVQYQLLSQKGCSYVFSRALEVPEKSVLTALPNPANTFIEVHGWNNYTMDWQIITTTGIIIQQGRLGQDHRIPVAQLPTGMYILRLQANDQTVHVMPIFIDR